jgi:hypothetical protein
MEWFIIIIGLLKGGVVSKRCRRATLYLFDNIRRGGGGEVNPRAAFRVEHPR